MYEHSTFNLSDALPCSDRAKSIRNDLSKQLSESLIHLIDISEDVISSADALRQFCDKPTNVPLLYCVNAEWFDAVQNENIDKVRLCATLLHQLAIMPQFATFLNFNEFQFSPFLIEMLVKNMTATFPEQNQVWVEPASSAKYEKSVKLIQRALIFIKKIDEHLYGESHHLVENYVTVDSNRIVYGSGFTLFGMIFLKAFDGSETLFDVIEMIVHESAHHYIFAVSVFDPLVLNSPTELFKSPFRKDPRPMMGIYHAAFVLGRLLYIFSKLISHVDEIQISSKEIIDKIKDYDARFQFSMELILNQARLTELGRNLIMSTQTMTHKALVSAFKVAA